MNLFVVVVSVLYTAAFVVDAWRGQWLTALIWAGYAVSGFCLAKVGGH